ncbi:MAG: hypothetical protein QM619_00440 [Micropruina sp.]|uniref:hypothetical protein n=1 Tax=Micropruina sp. TaxID=2737536 RepID=UPI0039E67D14
MKGDRLTTWAVLTADQRNSRRSADRVPGALAALAVAVGDRLALPFERTIGDELQALTADPAAVVDVVLTLSRLSDWHIGIGLGAVDLPLPASTREARGPAYLAARTAVEEARNAPANLRLIASETVSADPYRDIVAQRAEAALVMLRALVSRRTREGWEVMDVLDDAGSGKTAAGRLGISPSAVSQRAARAARAESRMGAGLAASLLAEAMGVTR